MEKKPVERLYTVAEAAQVLGLSPAKVYRLVIQGKIKSTHFGGNRCISRDWLEEYAGAAGKTVGEGGIGPLQGPRYELEAGLADDEGCSTV